MDCDLMTITAHEILSRVGVHQTFALQYNTVTHIVNHANGKIGDLFIERTNFKQYGLENGGREFTPKETPTEIASVFLNTYKL